MHRIITEYRHIDNERWAVYYIVMSISESAFFEGWHEGEPKGHSDQTQVFLQMGEVIDIAERTRDAILNQQEGRPKLQKEAFAVTAFWVMQAVRSFDFKPTKHDDVICIPSFTPSFVDRYIDDRIVQETNPAFYYTFESAKQEALTTFVGMYVASRRN